jgi:hypothetical protein
MTSYCSILDMGMYSGSTPTPNESIHVLVWLKFELQEIKVEGLVNTLGHMSWHPPNHTRREYVHPDGSVRIEHVAGV